MHLRTFFVSYMFTLKMVQKDFDTVSSLSARKRSKPVVFGSKKKPLIVVCEDDDVIKIFSQEKAARNNSALIR